MIEESFVAIILIFITTYLWLSGKKNREISNTGWKLIVAGFSLMSIGYIADAFDDIWFIENYVEGTIFETIFEDILGRILSFILLGIGIISWIPTISSAERLRSEVEGHRVARNELGKKTSILKGLLDSIPDMVFFKDSNGEYMGCNPAFSEHVTLPVEEVKGKKDHELFPEKKATYLCNLSKEIMETGKIKRYEECIDDGNRQIFIETIKSPLLNGEGKCIGIAGISRDITSRKKADEILRAKASTEAANKARNQFFANMSHEIRTPLNSIIGFSEILFEGIAGDLNKQQQQYIMNINKSGNHLLELINNILDLSKIEAGKMEIDPEQFTVSETFQEISDIMESLSIKKRVHLKFIIGKNIPAIHADKMRFKQIIYNLVSNAIKFTPEGGKVEVFAEKAENMLIIKVSDTGEGISEENQKRLFQPFEQANASHTYEGTGLGLFLVKKYIEMHKGNIRIESEPGKGSSFILELPLNAEEKD
ncbi:ATP-binding protein [Methanolobus sp. ZRKC2]|uniref:PAS domain-containing sensor histidine kinase n=1 Tax=Methanolobus sp. ZRKC2 TaxID=3125783 RepID=UPI00324D91FA